GKLAGLLKASKNLDNLIESQRKDLSWTGLPEFVDDIVTDYSRPMPTVESTSEEDTQSEKNKKETPKKSQVKYAKQYRQSNKKPNVRGNQRNWNNLTSYQLGLDFVMTKKACFNCGDFFHLANDCRKRVQRETTRSASHRPHGAPMRPPHRSTGHRPHEAPMRSPHKSAGHRPHGPSMNLMRPNMNGARPNRSFFIQAHSYETRPFFKTSAVKTHYRAPWVPTVNRNNPHVNRKFSTSRRNFPTANRKFPTASKKFPTRSTKIHTADMGRKEKAVKPSACWIWMPTQNLSNKVPRTTLMIKTIGTVAALGT
nr:ubiquitin hydrolase [Tanacetum cinerariifolium]